LILWPLYVHWMTFYNGVGTIFSWLKELECVKGSIKNNSFPFKRNFFFKLTNKIVSDIRLTEHRQFYNCCWLIIRLKLLPRYKIRNLRIRISIEGVLSNKITT